MALIYEMNPDFINGDSRGKLVQLIQGGYCQVNCIESVAGAIRGYHYHKLNREAFYIIKGELEIAVWKIDDKGKPNKETFEISRYREGDFFGIETFTAHVFNYLEDSTLVSLYDKGVELADGSKDIWEANETDFFLMKEGR